MTEEPREERIARLTRQFKDLSRDELRKATAHLPREDLEAMRRFAQAVQAAYQERAEAAAEQLRRLRGGYPDA